MAPHISVVIAMRHPIVAFGVQSALKQCPDVEVVAQCFTLSATRRAIRRFTPRVVIVGTGLCETEHGAIETLANLSADTRVALFCTHDGDLPEHAVLEGATAVLPPDITLDQFVEAVRAVASGRRWRVRLKAAATGRRPRREPHSSTQPALAELTARERQIAQGIAVGKRNREIAEAFDISPGTVKLHLNRIYAKLGVNSRLALFKKMFSEGSSPD